MNKAEKKKRVERMFDDIAPTYDMLNHLLSIGIDRLWRRKLVKMAMDAAAGGSAQRVKVECVTRNESAQEVKILDVATGTGDLAMALARKLPDAQIVGVDISEKMLEVGRRKVEKAGLSQRVVLQTGDAEALEFADETFDVVTVAFGVRNFGDIEAGLDEMKRVLKKGGTCLVLEFSEPKSGLFGALYGRYFKKLLPLIGRAVSRDREAYSYLPQSVSGFPTPEIFAEMLCGKKGNCAPPRRLTLGVAYIYRYTK